MFQCPHIKGYTPLETLGDGVSATVVSARHNKSKEKVALKLVERGYFSRNQKYVLNEISTMLAIRHRNILKLHKSFFVQGTPVMVLELAEMDMLTYALSDECIKETTIQSIIYQLLKALKAIHSYGLVHRDVKLENILIGKDGLVKLGDFGLTIPICEAIKGTEAVAGTPQYFPPEVYIGNHTYSEKFDIWGVGVVTFAIITKMYHHELEGDTEEMRKRLMGIYQRGAVDWSEYRNVLNPLQLNFLQRVMVVYPELRPSARTCMKLPWLKDTRTRPIITSTKKHNNFLRHIVKKL